MQGSLEPSETPAAETPLLAAMAESNDTTQHSTAATVDAHRKGLEVAATMEQSQCTVAVGQPSDSPCRGSESPNPWLRGC